MALGAPPVTESNWSAGAVGEEMVAAALRVGCRDEVAVLHDRARPPSGANIDHIAIASSGVWVIDTKRYQGRRVTVREPLFGKAQLTIDGRDRTKLVQGLTCQVETVAGVVHAVMPHAPVRGAFCFVGADLPLLGIPSIAGYQLLRRRSLVKRLNTDGPLSSEDIERLICALARALPPAT